MHPTISTGREQCGEWWHFGNAYQPEFAPEFWVVQSPENASNPPGKETMQTEGIFYAAAWSLADWANLAQILSLLGLPLTVIAWLITREQTAKFWSKNRNWIFGFFALLFLVGLWRFGWLNWVGAFLSYRVPVWGVLLGLLVVAAIVAGFIVVALWYEKHKSGPKTPEQYTPDDYKSDFLYEADWHWNYSDSTINEPHPFCPRFNCQSRLEIQRDSSRSFGYHLNGVVNLVCPNCGFRREYDYTFAKLQTLRGCISTPC